MRLTRWPRCPAHRALRSEQIKLQVALITPLMHIEGYAAPETMAAAERVNLLIEQAKALGEPPEDPLLLFLVLHGFWLVNAVAFNGDALHKLAKQFLMLAEQQAATFPVQMGHSMMGFSSLLTGDLAQARKHYDDAIGLYDPAAHLSPGMRFGQDGRVAILSYRSVALWMLGYPDAALADANNSLQRARKIDQAGSLLFALSLATVTEFLRRDYATAKALADDLFTLADEKGALFWKPGGALYRGWLCAVAGDAVEAVQLITSGLAAFRSTGSTQLTPVGLSFLAKAYADLGRFDDAWRCVDEARTLVETGGERWFEPHIYCIAGEVALKSSQPDASKAQSYFERALSVARQQQAKSWELRAAMSMARLWRDQGKVSEARELLAPIYGWFTEGFDTRDLKEAKALLEELAASGHRGPQDSDSGREKSR